MTEHTVLQALKRAYDKARERGEPPGTDVRSTTEVAEYCGMATDVARWNLRKCVHAGTAEVFQNVPLLWRITDKGRTALVEQG